MFRVVATCTSESSAHQSCWVMSPFCAGRFVSSGCLHPPPRRSIVVCRVFLLFSLLISRSAKAHWLPSMSADGPGLFQSLRRACQNRLPEPRRRNGVAQWGRVFFPLADTPVVTRRFRDRSRKPIFIERCPGRESGPGVSFGGIFRRSQREPRRALHRFRRHTPGPAAAFRASCGDEVEVVRHDDHSCHPPAGLTILPATGPAPLRQLRSLGWGPSKFINQTSTAVAEPVQIRSALLLSLPKRVICLII